MPSCPAEARREAVHAAQAIADAFLGIARTDTRMLAIFLALARLPEPPPAATPRAAAEAAFQGPTS